eukprot:6406331-Prymnesium_polylepis.1
MRCYVVPACPTRSPCRGAGWGGPLACRRRARDGCACDVEGDHPVVDRVEKMRISGECILKDQGQ